MRQIYSVRYDSSEIGSKVVSVSCSKQFSLAIACVSCQCGLVGKVTHKDGLNLSLAMETH